MDCIVFLCAALLTRRKPDPSLQDDTIFSSEATDLEGMYSGNMLDYEVTPTQLAAILSGADREKTVLLDVREPEEYALVRIDGSILMPMGDVPGRAYQELDPDTQIITICHHGVRSMNVAVWLRNQGFEHTQSLRGGIDAWAALIDPAMPRY